MRGDPNDGVWNEEAEIECSLNEEVLSRIRDELGGGSRSNPSSIRLSVADLLHVCDENERLTKQVAELQRSMTAMVEKSLPRRVRAFHEKFGHPVRHTPTVPSEEEVRFRIRLITEEYLEFLTACVDVELIGAKKFRSIIGDVPIKVNLVDAYDALLDLAYVIEGTHATFGTLAEPGMVEVQRSNMEKDPNGPDGKPVKGPGWKPPQIEKVLRDQGAVLPSGEAAE